MIEVLTNKIRFAKVTDASPCYKGSITLDPKFIRDAGMYPWQKVHVNARDKDVRIITYILEGEEGSGAVELNGGAAQYLKPGDIIHINAYGLIEKKMARSHRPIILESTFDMTNE